MTRRVAVALIAFALVMAACNPGAEEAAEFEGNWKSDTWGTYLSISGGSAEIFEYTDVHCFGVGGGGVRGISDVLTLDAGTLTLADAGRSVRFASIDFLPTACAAPVVGDPRSTFDVTVATIEAHHAPGVDDGWSERVERLRPATDATADADTMFGILTELLDPLDHPDVRIASPDRDIWRSDAVAVPSLLEGESAGFGGIVRASFDGAAYIGFLRMGSFGEVPEDSAGDVAAVIDAAAVADAMVLDLRASDGGSVTDAMVVASRFVPDERVVARYDAFGPTGFETAGETGVRPLGIGTYSGTTYVLIGPATAGAAELLAEAVRGVDGVTLIGSATAGAPAPRMVRQLPNGWVIGLSNLSVVSPDGEDLTTGVVPDIVAHDPLGVVGDLLAAAG